MAVRKGTGLRGIVVMNRDKVKGMILDCIGAILIGVIFLIPFLFILVNSLKERREAGLMRFSLPEEWNGAQNYMTVIEDRDFQLLRAFGNSAFISAATIVILIAVCSMAGYVLQRRKGTACCFVQMLILIGLMLPPSILPTIWVLDFFGIFPDVKGLILVETALQIPFVTMLYRSYIATIPKEIEEAAVIDGCGGFVIFRKIIFPLVMPVTASVVVLTAVTVFNDFVNPLYFLPGAEHVTVSLTMYSFIGQYGSEWNLLFADIVLISIPPLILYIIFHKKIVEGIAGTSLKG